MAAGIVVPFKVMAVQVTIYLTEGDSWHHRPLHLEILKYLREENVFGAVAFHAVAGFLGRGIVHTAHLVEAGGELPVVISFVDTDEHVNRDLNLLRLWIESKPDVAEGLWYKDFTSFELCGEGKYPKTFLMAGQAAEGRKL